MACAGLRHVVTWWSRSVAYGDKAITLRAPRAVDIPLEEAARAECVGGGLPGLVLVTKGGSRHLVDGGWGSRTICALAAMLRRDVPRFSFDGRARTWAERVRAEALPR
ncbi:MAG TPA: hypothetical protein VFH47_09100 [Candidatus Thermoplasmatota archaeon]|nr:hypothetical protein [Candidatus Thermoplasmatota archaeon]